MRQQRRCRRLVLLILFSALAYLSFNNWSNNRRRDESRGAKRMLYEDKVVIPMYTKWFGQDDIWEGMNIVCPNLPKTCVFSHDRSFITENSLVLFHAPDVNPLHLPKRHDKQKWVLWSAESPLNDAWQLEAGNLRPFDYSMNYRLDSDFPWTYVENTVLDIALKPVPIPPAKRKAVPVVWMASNCKAENGRHHFVKELQKYIAVDSLGWCQNNAPRPSKDLSLVDILKLYKFYLSLENSNCDDYVTEKFTNALEAGVVPIVDGPKDYSAFEPATNSLIRVDSFPSVRHLAEHLLLLNGNDTLYEEYLAHKYGKRELTPKFMKTWGPPNGVSTTNTKCKLCETAIALQKAEPILSPLRTTAIVPDRSCTVGKWNFLQEQK